MLRGAGKPLKAIDSSREPAIGSPHDETSMPPSVLPLGLRSASWHSPPPSSITTGESLTTRREQLASATVRAESEVADQDELATHDPGDRAIADTAKDDLLQEAGRDFRTTPQEHKTPRSRVSKQAPMALAPSAAKRFRNPAWTRSPGPSSASATRRSQTNAAAPAPLQEVRLLE